MGEAELGTAPGGGGGEGGWRWRGEGRGDGGVGEGGAGEVRRDQVRRAVQRGAWGGRRGRRSSGVGAEISDFLLCVGDGGAVG